MRHMQVGDGTTKPGQATVTLEKDETSLAGDPAEWCTNCGGHVFTEHPGMGLTDVYAALLPELPFRAGIHVHYQEAVLPIKAGVTKMKDVPAELGGSGETMED